MANSSRRSVIAIVVAIVFSFSTFSSLAKKKPKRRSRTAAKTEARANGVSKSNARPPIVLPPVFINRGADARVASAPLTTVGASQTTAPYATTSSPLTTGSLPEKAPTAPADTTTVTGRPLPLSPAGDLDTSFSGDGKQTKDVTTADDHASAVAIQSDGKIVIAGSCNGTPGSPGTNSNNFLVARFNADGSLDDGTAGDSTPGDGAFATAGVFVLDFNTGDDRGQAIAIQTDGKIVVGGYATQSGNNNFALIRLTTTGAIDSGFGVGGKVTTNLSPTGKDQIHAIVIQSDGKIVAGGEAFGTASTNADFAVARYNTNGSLDDGTASDSTPGDSYGAGGFTKTDFGTADDIGWALALQPDGKAVLAGKAVSLGAGGGFNFGLARYTTTGVLDTTFGATDSDGINGVTMTDFNSLSEDEAFAIAIQTDGKIVAAGHTFATSYRFALARYNTNGSLDDNGASDTTPGDAFDGDGKRVDDFATGPDTIYSLIIQSDGKIVAGGLSGTDAFGNPALNDFRIARYTSSGSLDAGFGSGGSTATDFAGNQDEIYGLALQSDGKIVAAGIALEVLSGGPNIALARYLGAGPATATAGQLFISEFRLRGPGAASDEFIEIYNNSGAGHTVAAASGTGYGIAASDGTTRCTIPNGTVIPNKGHYLCVNSSGYSLGTYPAGNGTTATGDATYTTDIPENAGIALFNNNTGGASYSIANRLDAVGSSSEANTTYKEGAGYAAVSTGSLEYSFVRDECGKGGASTTGPCTLTGPKDTDNNAADFIFIDTTGTATAAGQHLGAPGPQNLTSPIERNSTITVVLLDPCFGNSSAPNRVRDLTPDPVNNSPLGTLDLRRTVTNNTGGNVTRLRFRIFDITSFPPPAGMADLRARTSSDISVTVDRPPCGSTSSITVRGTTLEQPPSQTLAGGALNSTLSSGTITLGAPLANGATIDVRFLLGVVQAGNFRIYVNIEALP